MTGLGGWYHCSVKTMGRSAGRSVVAAAAYRLGDRLHEAAIDQTHDYRRKGGVLSTFTCAPADAPAWALDPERLWNAANAAEKRINSTLAREVELALPACITAEARQGIVHAFAQQLVDRYGVAVSVGIHEPGERGDQRNHHAHILFTTRRMEPDGLGAKTRVLDDRKTGPQEVIHLRAYAAELINAALEDAGSDDRVDHRSFADRGIGQEPTTHLGPAGKAIERKRAASDRSQVNEGITAKNQAMDKLVQELAELDAKIAADREKELDGTASPGLTFQPLPGPDLSMFLPQPAPDGRDDFEAVHKQTVELAIADLRSVEQDEASDPESRFERVRAWWGNMREAFSEWRDYLQERVEHYRGQWDRGQGSHDEVER